ncbi:MAG TPA: hypothetical protein VN512_06605 [Clostridia bacterium]|nr:hypothetical protein [Clostridia bacterium]
MESEQVFIQDMIERYVFQASRHMPRAGREDAARELRALINDMLAERANGLPPTKKQLEAVFVELGSPKELGAKYRGTEGRVLIGPAIYPLYIKIVKIVAIVVPFALALAMLIQTILGELYWYAAIGQWFAGTFTGLFTALGVITFIFAVLEYKEVKLDNIDLDTQAGPFDLPPVQKEPERPASLAGAVASVVLTLLFSLLFAFTPNLFSFYTPDSFIPLFHAARVQELIPVVLILMVLQIGGEVYRYLDAPHGARPFAIVTVLSAACLFMNFIVFGDGTVWNASFLQDVLKYFNVTEPMPGVIWGNFTRYFPLLLIFAFVLETGTNAGKMFNKKKAA